MIAVISLLLVLTISVIVIVSRARGIGHPSCVLAQGPSTGVMVSPSRPRGGGRSPTGVKDVPGLKY